MASRCLESDSMGMYLKEMHNFHILSSKEEHSLFEKLESLKKELLRDDLEISEQEKEDLMFEKKHITDRLYESCARLVVKMAKFYLNKGLSLSDLVQEGNIGLLIAIEKFDLSFNCRLTTYAACWIKQTIVDALHNKSRMVRLPVGIQDKIDRLYKDKKTLEEDLRREVSIEELATFSGMNSSKIRYLFNISNISSLDVTVGKGEDCLVDFIQDESVNVEDDIVNRIYSDKLNEIIENELDERSQKIIKMRYGYPEYGKAHTLKEVSIEIGVTKEWTRQLQKIAITKRLRSSERIQELSYW